MPETAVAIEPTERVWFDKEAAADYCRSKGLSKITANSIDYAAYKRKTLHMPDVNKGEGAYWHKDWLDAWIESK